MEELTKAAKAFYANLADDEKREVEDLFSSMDKNGDGKISLREFMASANEGGINPMEKRSIFNLVDQDGDGSLQKDDILTLCYLAVSGRPNCDGCGTFIPGLFFTCTHCRLTKRVDVKDSYDLCIPCYHGKEFVHDHTEFVDNYMLLFSMQEKLSSGEQDRVTQSRSSGALAIAESSRTSASHSFKYNGSKTTKMEKMKRALEIFATVLSVATNVPAFS